MLVNSSSYSVNVVLLISPVFLPAMTDGLMTEVWLQMIKL